MKNNFWIPIALVAFLCMVLLIFTAGTLISYIFIPTLLITLPIYYATVYQKDLEIGRTFELYLLALSIQFLHFAEEYAGRLYQLLPELLGFPAISEVFFVTFNMIAYFLFLSGALCWMRKIRTFMIIPLFFILIGVMGNGILHVLLSIAVKGYFPGLYTALAYLVLGPILIRRIWKETR